MTTTELQSVVIVLYPHSSLRQLAIPVQFGSIRFDVKRAKGSFIIYYVLQISYFASHIRS